MSKTVSLDPAEWKTLALTGVSQMHAFYSSINAPTAQDLQTISAQLDRMRAFALAWHLSQHPAPTPSASPAQTVLDAVVTAVTRPTMPSNIPAERNKGGRPKGSKNKPKVRQVKNGVGVTA